jgi:peptide deformylase
VDNINLCILTPKKESKFGQNNPENRRTLSNARGLIMLIRVIGFNQRKVGGFMNLKILSLWVVFMSFVNQNFADNIPIVTIDSPLQHVLKTKTEPLQADELPLAREIIDKLLFALKPYLPAAGLAAPQIGISKSVFIFSFDRDPNHLEGVINPSFMPVGDTKIEGWEGCFSVMLSHNGWKLAKIPRYETIQVQYLNMDGEQVEKILEGFAAKVFQHEYDHLQGVENIDREDAVIMDFTTEEEMMNFMSQVKKEDSLRYKRPLVS